MPTTSKPQTWLITGSSSGFGLSLARSVLARGHNVIATSRNPSRTPKYVEEIESTGRGRWLTLDVTADAANIKSTMHKAYTLFGKIDVLVNNAGYMVLGAAEDIPEDQAKAEFEVNLWGVIRVTQATLPMMRAQGHGRIVMISSVAGIQATPLFAMYAASKFALEAWSESMAQEVAPLGIRVLIVEPGSFRTNVLSENAMQVVPFSSDYKDGPADVTLQRLESRIGKQLGDPSKACEKIVDNVERGLEQYDLGKVEKLRLPLGQDSYDRIMVKMAMLSENWSSTKDDALGTQVDE